MKREVWLDFLRVTACLMVMVIHSTEPFYLGGEGGLILSATDAFWVAVFEGICRCCVPVFLVASAYLQFPLHYSTGEFFRRRAVRILVPMVIWTVVYALAFGDPVQNFKGLLLKVSLKELEVYLGIWLLTTLFPFIREAAGGEAPLIQAADGLPAQALFPLWGEASWNPFGLFYYVSGFFGYLLLGLYLRRFVADRRWLKLAGCSLFLLGFAAIVGGLLRRFSDTSDGFPLTGPLSTAVAWETPVTFCGLPVVMTTVGILLLFRSWFSGCSEESAFYRRVILPLSKAGYGMYLIHMLVLAQFSGWFRSWLGLGSEGVLGAWTTPVQILGTTLCSFVVVGLVAVLLQRIPRVGKYLMG